MTSSGNGVDIAKEGVQESTEPLMNKTNDLNGISSEKSPVENEEDVKPKKVGAACQIMYL